MGTADTKPLISVIVPIYNVEQYLRECVDSIRNQTYRNLEIILVDDGSPDGCPAICDEYAEKDSRIKVIHKKNGGLSDARNEGMKVCRGEYLMFVDSDDLIPADAMEHLFHVMEETGAELSVGGHCRMYEGKEPEGICRKGTVRVLDKEMAMQDFFQNGCAAWARLYKRSVHEGIQFPVGEINEDEAIVLFILERCTRVAFSSQTVYGYRCREESITTASFHKKKLAWVKHCYSNLLYIDKRHLKLKKYAAERYRSSLLWALDQIACSKENYHAEAEKIIKELKKNKNWFYEIPYFYQKDKYRLMFYIHLPFFLCRCILKAPTAAA